MIDRTLTGIARLALRGFFRDLEVVGREQVPEDRPLLLVANHFNALLDAVLVMHALGRLPRFVAKAALWRPAWARPFLWLAGMVPVTRPQDGGDTGGNHSAFVSCHEQLARGGAVALFPEGGLSRAPRLRKLRTGAARIALGARVAGARGLTIVPVGLFYEDKVALRSRALVRIGVPIDLDVELARFGLDDATEDDVEVVQRLTAEIERRLGDAAPMYEHEHEAAVFGTAAEVALRDPDRLPPRPVPLVSREELAGRLVRAPRPERERVHDALARYQLGLSLTGLRDAYLVAEYRVRRLAALFLSAAATLLLVAPFALVGAAVNVLPYWGVHWAGRLVRDPALAASARLLAGVALFPTAWVLAAWLAPWDSWPARIGIVAASPVLGLVAVRALEQAVAVRRTWRGWITLVERRGDRARLRADRGRLVDLVERTARVEDRPGRDEVPAHGPH
jgi:glycerol-3-phosphate O-acyltransferase / dihydroxyacetone phosphate acyltransferase